MVNRHSGLHALPTSTEEEFKILYEEERDFSSQITEKIKGIINDQEKSKGTYKGILYDLKDALSIAMTTQDEHDKEIYKRIYDYITERMREVDESRKENE